MVLGDQKNGNQLKNWKLSCLIYMHHWTDSPLVQVMACCLFGTKPLQQNIFQNVVCKMASILFGPHGVKSRSYYDTNLESNSHWPYYKGHQREIILSTRHTRLWLPTDQLKILDTGEPLSAFTEKYHSGDHIRALNMLGFFLLLLFFLLAWLAKYYIFQDRLHRIRK